MKAEDGYYGMRVVAKDAIIVNAGKDGYISEGDLGTLIEVPYPDNDIVGVQWDNLTCGHDLCGELPSGSHDGYFVLLKLIEPYIDDDDLVCPNDLDFSKFMEV